VDTGVLADPILRTLLMRAGTSLAQRVFEGVIGTARQRETAGVTPQAAQS
jgi:hypothetical protein